MARKNGLNRKEQLQCATWLEEGVKAKDIAKKFGTSVEIIQKFTPKKLDAADKAAKERTAKQGKIAQSRRATADILKEVIDSDAEGSKDFI